MWINLHTQCYAGEPTIGFQISRSRSEANTSQTSCIKIGPFTEQKYGHSWIVHKRAQQLNKCHHRLKYSWFELMGDDN